MSFFAHFIKNEQVAALHIAENAVSVLSFTHKSKRLNVVHIGRVSLPEGTIIEGRVVDTSILTRALRDLRIKSKAHRHVIVSIPQLPVFTKAVVFPDTLDEKSDASRLLETANLALEWNVPFTPAERYADVDILKEPAHGMQIHAITIENATPYITSLTRAGFKLVALESEHDAIARTIEPTEYIITNYSSNSYENILACRDSFAIFSNTYPLHEWPNKTARSNAIKRAAEFVASRFGKRPVIKLFEKLPLLEEVREVIESRNDTTLIPLLGTALRARVARRDDIAASLLPIGTEEAYEYQKLEAFVGSLSVLTLITALIIAGASAFAWYGVKTELATLPKDDALTETLGANETFLTEHEHYKRFSTVVATVGPLATEETSFAKITAFLRQYAINGIALRDITAEKGTVRIDGVARSRTHLNTFRDTLRATPEVASIDLPITDAELRGDIPFQITITFKENIWQSWRTNQ